MGTFIPPQNFGMVEENLYRCGQPSQLNFPFLEKLRLRTITWLGPDEPDRVLRTWLDDQGIELVQLAEAVGAHDPSNTVSEEVRRPEHAARGAAGEHRVECRAPRPQVILDGLGLLLDPANYPLMVMCTMGRHRTGTMIGCLRKLQGWNLTSTLEEYRRHAGPRIRVLNEQFIELFDTDLVMLPLGAPRWLNRGLDALPEGAAPGSPTGRGAWEQAGRDQPEG